jgi:hypothetical protein
VAFPFSIREKVRAMPLLDAHRGSQRPTQNGRVKKIVPKSGKFTQRKNMVSKHQRLPRNSPQSHHQKTTFCTRFLAKPPAKMLFLPGLRF